MARPKGPAVLTITDLKAFAAVAETGSTRLASQQLHISPSAVTQHLTRLGPTFGDELFEKCVSGLALTQRGAIVATHVREALECLARAEQASKQNPPLRVAYSPVARDLIVETMKRLKDSLEVRPIEATAPAFRQLTRREIDLAIGYDLSPYRYEDSEFNRKLILTQSLDLVVPMERAKDCGSATPKLLEGLRWAFISRSLLRKHHDAAKAWLDNEKVVVDDDHSVGCRTAGELLALVATNQYFGFLPKLCARSAGPDVHFMKIKSWDYRSFLYAYYWPTSGAENARALEPDPEVGRFMSQLEDVCKSDAFR